MSKKPIIRVDRIGVIDNEGPTQAYVDLLVLETFLVKDLRIVQGNEGLFVSMPQKRGRDGRWYDLFFPLSKTMRKGLEQLILDEYAQIQNC